jgi:deoxyribodipyrimidine photo-lyase
MIDLRRIRILNKGKKQHGPILYLMSRDQRVHDNHALLYAQESAKEKNVPFGVLFCLKTTFLNATLRQYSFMLEGLQQLEKELNKFHIPFFLIPDNKQQLKKFLKKHHVSLIITDFSPLKYMEKRAKYFPKDIPHHEVDAHNIVPCWIASTKQEYSAFTFRKKITPLLQEFLTPFDTIKKQKKYWPSTKINWEKCFNLLKIDKTILPITWLKSSEKAAIQQLKKFDENNYSQKRNDPNANALSNLSPYIHFGQISAQKIALTIKDKAFLEELIVRRELADNYCFYNENYDNFNGAPHWAKKSLKKHIKDKREYLYSLKKLENAKTHDPLWNAAQKQMVITGKMHGYLRMYWAKKILQWTQTPTLAWQYALYLNDKYELDGRDPNGFVGIAWALFGLHDRPWQERKIFGLIRYMSFDGMKKKFNVNSFIERYK